MNILSFLHVLLNKKGYFFVFPRFFRRKREVKGKGEAIFIMTEEGNWEREGVLIQNRGTSSYTVWITGTKEGKWEEEDWVSCEVPNVITLLHFLGLLTNDRTSLFTSDREHTPSNTIC